MKVGEQVKMSFHGVDVVKLHFDSKKPSEVANRALDVSIDPFVFYPKDTPLNFAIIIKLHISQEDFFNLELEAIGMFALNVEVDTHVKKNFVNVNAPAIMFPYLRAFVTTLTANMGSVTGPLVMPPQFFNGEIEEISLES